MVRLTNNFSRSNLPELPYIVVKRKGRKQKGSILFIIFHIPHHIFKHNHNEGQLGSLSEKPD